MITTTKCARPSAGNFLFLLLLLLNFFTPSNAVGQSVRSSAGADAASIVPIVNLFRADLGGGNAPDVGFPGRFGGLRREINWDGVPDAFAAPNNFPANFFNANSPRGVIFSTPGTGFQVSANAGSGVPTNFGNINPTYPILFAAFSAQRLFTPLGANITDIHFFMPGTNIPATTRGFGAVFSDDDPATPLANASTIEYFDNHGNSLGVFQVPNFGGNQTFSFLGVSFPAPIVSMVRIVAGSSALGVGVLETPDRDLVVLDDFIYGEPGPALPVWYRDVDRDGFGDPATFVQAATEPIGFVDNNQDCNDHLVTYRDADGDGFGTNIKVGCGGVANRQDCNDSDPTVQTPKTYFRDADGDGYGDATASIFVCSATPPPGYVSNFRDCNDSDPTAFAQFTFYRDADGDGVGNTAVSITLCHSSTPPAGYVRMQNDCDDNNAAIQYPKTYFRDADGDGYGDWNGRAFFCSLTPPAGYVTNFSDCDDANAGVHTCPHLLPVTNRPVAGEESAATFTLAALPNPVANTTRLLYSLPVAAKVSLKLYDLLGREVSTLFDGEQQAGNYSQEFNVSRLSSGVYYCRMMAIAGGKMFVQTQKLVKTDR